MRSHEAELGAACLLHTLNKIPEVARLEAAALALRIWFDGNMGKVARWCDCGEPNPCRDHGFHVGGLTQAPARERRERAPETASEASAAREEFAVVLKYLNDEVARLEGALAAARQEAEEHARGWVEARAECASLRAALGAAHPILKAALAWHGHIVAVNKIQDLREALWATDESFDAALFTACAAYVSAALSASPPA